MCGVENFVVGLLSSSIKRYREYSIGKLADQYFIDRRKVVIITISSNMATCRASCTLVNQQTASVSILGHLLLEETDGIVSVRGKIHNLHPGKHGITVCIAGDLSHGATSCGPIFNPFGKPDKSKSSVKANVCEAASACSSY